MTSPAALYAMQNRVIRRRNLDEILTHMQVMADSEYEGDLQAHVLEIFRTLNEEEQRVILRRSLVLQWERMLDESKEELTRTSGFYHEEDETIREPEAHRGADYRISPPKTEKEKEALEYADKVKGWKDLGIRVLLIALIITMVSMLFSTALLDKDASFKGVMSLLDSFIGILY